MNKRNNGPMMRREGSASPQFRSSQQAGISGSLPAARGHLRPLYLGSTALVGFATIASVAGLGSGSARAQTWLGTTSDFNTTTNWNPATVPTAGATATFAGVGATTVTISTVAQPTPGAVVFNAGAQAYTITETSFAGSIAIIGAGITNNSSQVQTLSSSGGGTMQFENSASAGTNTLLTASSGGFVQFFNTSSGAGATVQLGNGGTLGVETAGNLNLGALSGVAGSGVNFVALSSPTPTLTVGALNGTSTFAGVISDNNSSGAVSGALVKAGTGMLTLSNANTYKGGTTVSAGTLAISNNSALGAGGVTLVPGSTLALQGVTITNAVSGSGDPNILVTGASAMPTYTGNAATTFNILGADNSATTDVLTLTTANATYAGLTNVGGTAAGSSVTLKAGAANSFGAASTVSVFAGSVLDINGFAQSTNSLSGAGTVTNSSATTAFFANTGPSSTFSGTITGSALNLEQNSTGNTLTLTGANTYGGTTLVNAGTLALSASGSIANSLQVEVASGATFDISTTNSGATVQALQDTGAPPSGSVVLGSKTLTINNIGAAATFSGVISGAGGLTLLAGTQILSGTNTYTGATNVNGGTLKGGAANTFSAGSATTANTGGTIDLGGFAQTINSVTLAGGTIQNGSLTGAIGSTGGTINGIGGSTSVATSAGTTTLLGANTYTGATNVNGGTLKGGVANSFSAGSATTANVGGTIDFGGFAQTINNLTLAGGTIQNGTLTSSGGIGSTGGTISNVTGTSSLTTTAGTTTLAGTDAFSAITNGATATISDTGTVNVSGLVTNNGTFGVTATGKLTAGGVTNNAGATFTVAQGGTVTDVLNNSGSYTNSGTDNADVNNTGAVASLTNTSTGVWNGNLLSNTGGALLTNQGAWNGSGNNASGTVDNQGTWTTAAAGFTNAGTFKNSTAGSILDATNGGLTNTGIVQAQGTIKGTIQNNAAGTFTVTGALVGNNTFTNNGTAQLAVTGGNFTGITTLTNNSTSANAVKVALGDTLSATVAINNTAGTFTNAGTLTAPVISNSGTGTLTTTGTVNAATSLTNSATLNAQGTITTPLVTNTGTFALTGALGGAMTAFNNNGTGTLNVGANALTGIGTLTNNSTSATAVQVAAGGSIGTGGSPTAINNTAGTFTNAGTLNASTLNNTGGTLTSTGTLATTGGLANNGTGIVNAAGTLNSAVTNTGQFNVTGALADNGSAFTNNTGGTLAVGTNAFTGIGALTNVATVTVGTGGTLSAATIANNSGGTLTSTGTLTTTGGLANNGTGIVNANGGAVNGLIANSAAFNVGGTVTSNSTFGNANGATLAIAGAGNYTITGLLTNSGTLTVALGGKLTDNAGINDTSTGTITNNGTITDVLTNAGTVTNNGTYNADVNNTGTVTNNLTWNGNLLSNTGTVTNAAAGTWTGTATNNAGGTLTNSGTWVGNGTNLAGGSLINNKTWTGTMMNAGTFNNNAAGTLSGLLTNTAGTSTNAGTLNGGATVTGGTLTTTGTINGALINSAQVNAKGTVNGPVTNNAGGIVTLTGSVAGVTTFANAGTVNVSGTLPVAYTLGATAFNNAATGVITLQNGTIGDALTLTGTYAGTTGSMVALDVNTTSVGAIGGDQLAINGASTSGSSSLALKDVGPLANKTFFATPILLVNGSAGTTYTLATDANTQAVVAPTGLVSYSLQQLNPGKWSLVSNVNASAGTAGVSQIASLIAGLNASFFQSTSAFISGPANPTPNEFSGGPWIRFASGDDTITSQSTASFGGSSAPSNAAKIDTNFAGFQAGLDGGVFNINNSGMNVHFGVTAGQVIANSTDKDAAATGAISKGSSEIPFVGLYGAITGNNFFADVMWRNDFFHMSLTDITAPSNGVSTTLLSGTSESARASTVSGDIGYRFTLGHDWFIEPSAAINVSTAKVNAITFLNSGGAVAFSNVDSTLGRIGVRVGTTFVTGNFALQPFATASLWDEFAGNIGSTYQLNSTTANITTTRVGTFGQFGLGMSGQLIGSNLLGYVRADLRTGSNIQGWDITGGLRYQFQ